MDGGEAEDGVEDGWEAAAFVAPAPRRWTRTSPAERTFIRPGAAGKLEPPPLWQPRVHGAEEAEGEAEGREAAAGVEAE